MVVLEPSGAAAEDSGGRTGGLQANYMLIMGKNHVPKKGWRPFRLSFGYFLFLDCKFHSGGGINHRHKGSGCNHRIEQFWLGVELAR